MIYFIKQEVTNVIKIGYTKNNINSRIAQINAYSPYALTLIAKIPGDCKKEREIHRKFHHLRIKNEWFTYNDEISNFIKEIQDESILFHMISYNADHLGVPWPCTGYHCKPFGKCIACTMWYKWNKIHGNFPVNAFQDRD